VESYKRFNSNQPFIGLILNSLLIYIVIKQ